MSWPAFGRAKRGRVPCVRSSGASGSSFADTRYGACLPACERGSGWAFRPLQCVLRIGVYSNVGVRCVCAATGHVPAWQTRTGARVPPGRDDHHRQQRSFPPKGRRAAPVDGVGVASRTGGTRSCPPRNVRAQAEQPRLLTDRILLSRPSLLSLSRPSRRWSGLRPPVVRATQGAGGAARPGARVRCGVTVGAGRPPAASCARA